MLIYTSIKSNQPKVAGSKQSADWLTAHRGLGLKEPFSRVMAVPDPRLPV